MERDPLLPTDVIELNNGLKCAEWRIEKYERAGNRVAFSSGRFKYVVFDNVLLIYDLFFGTKRKFLPERIDCPIELLRYIHLAGGRGFVLYEATKSIQVSIINIDFDSGKYAFVGNSYCIFKYPTEVGQNFTCVDDVSRLSEDTIVVKTENELLGSQIYLFNLDTKYSMVEFKKTVTIADYSRWFSYVGNKIIFARFGLETRIDRCYLDNFMTVNEDGLLMELEGTGTCLQSRSELTDSLIYPCGIQGCWSENRFYVLCNFYPGNRALQSTIFLSVFDLKQRKWSEIRLNLPRINESYAKFNVSCGAMTLLQHIEEYEDGELSYTLVTSYRFPLGVPEKLLKIIWFKIYTIKNKAILPQNVPYTPFFG